jgi:hypothetical protein
MSLLLIHFLATLLELAAQQGVRPHDGNNQSVFLYTFTRNGEKKDTVVVTAGATFQLDLPPNSAQCVSVSAAMPFNLGDGATLKISIGEAEDQRPAAEVSLDPVHVRADRKWIPIRFAIPAGLKAIRVKFEAGPGKRNDSTADWIGLAPGPDSSCLLGSPSTRD